MCTKALAGIFSHGFYVIYALACKRQHLIVHAYCNHSLVKVPHWSSGDKFTGEQPTPKSF